MNYTVDANIFVSDLIQTDVHHADCQAFLTRLRQQPDGIYCPILVLVESVAAIARPTGNAVLAQRSLRAIARFPNMKLVSLTRRLAQHAARLAASYRLRGADAVYLAVAAEYGATLITWDKEMLQRGASVVTTMTPVDWLANPLPTP